MKTLQKLKWLIAAALLIVAVILILPHAGEDNQTKPMPSPDQISAASPSPIAPLAPTAKSGDPESVEEFSAFIRKFSATNSATNALVARVVSMRVTHKDWWRAATDFSSLLGVATDTGVPYGARVVAMRMFLTGVPKSELEKQSASLQATFSNASDEMVSTMLKDMTDRGVAPQTMIRQTLNSQQRSTTALCYAWDAARRTDPGNPEYVTLALAASEGGYTEASKVAFDFLAAAPHTAQVTSSPVLKQKVDQLVGDAKKLPDDAEIYAVANTDALILAMPNIMEAVPAKEALFAILETAPNPEIRLSALEQIVKLHLSGTENFSVELEKAKATIPQLFPDTAKQIRANITLKRVK